MQLGANHLFLEATSYIREICKPLYNLAIDYFSYTRSYPDGRRIYFNTSPEWLNNYFERDFHLIGNCELRPEIYKKPQTFLMSTLPKPKIFREAAEMGIQDGLFFINPLTSYTEFFEFSTFNPTTNMVNIFLNNGDLIRNFTWYFVNSAKTLIEQAERNHFILPHHNNANSFKKLLNTKEFSPFSHEKTVKLTQQQYQCAIRLLQSKSQKEIAKELGLSPRTVETYLNNLKNKLCVSNKTELILSLADLLQIRRPNKFLSIKIE